MNGRFVVVGAYVLDCFVRTSELPTWGEDREVRSIRSSPGGKALNQAVALARLGAQVTAVGTVADDPAGQQILATLAGEGVDTSGMLVRDTGATPLCVGLGGDDGTTSWLPAEVVDTTGASDAFTAALAWRLNNGRPDSDAIESALAAAARAISVPGGYQSMPH